MDTDGGMILDTPHGRVARVNKLENRPAGEGYKAAFAGIFTLMRRERRAPRTWATGCHIGGYEIRAEVMDYFTLAGWLAIQLG